MEKMNQVSVTEFMSKSKEEMYDMAVEMVEKYNRLVDICNDSAERIADLIERRNVYTSALNADIAAKAAKIDLLEKEIEGRKEGYAALKTQMDNARESASYWHDEYVKLQEENDEIDKDSKTHYDMYKYGEELLKVKDAEYNNMCQSLTLREEEIENLKKELDARGEEIRKLNKCIMNKNEAINTANDAIVNLRKEIGAHEDENKRLSEKIIELKKERDKHMARVNDLRMELDCVKASKEKHEEAARDKTIEDLRESFNYWRTQCLAAQEERDKLETQVKNLTTELEHTYKCKEADLKNHNKRDMTLVDELAKKNDEIKDHKETIEYHKNQERIRTDQLRATESKVEELWKEIEKLKVDLIHERDKNEKLAKDHAELENDMRRVSKERDEKQQSLKYLLKANENLRCYYMKAREEIKELKKEDDHGRAGFKEYIEWLVKEEERAVPERFKERLNEEITAIFKEEEETEVNDIPCGSDAIE